MVKIYIDTNIFIDIYQSATDPVDLLDDIAKYSQHLVTTAQTISEFHRNRVGVLNKLIKNFNSSVSFNPWCTSLIKHLPEFKELIEASKQVKEKARLIVQHLESSKNLSIDPVAQKVNIIFNNPFMSQIALTENLIKKAYQRKIFGNPPTSSDKDTIGDEVIWEALLAQVKEDLIIVTRDQTYFDNLEILKSEFKAKTNNHLILITSKVYEALKKLGETPPPKLVEEENRMSEEEKCPQCGARGEIYGYEGNEGDEAAWFECYKCGYIEMFHGIIN